MPMEISWFAPSCLGDTARLGVDDSSERAGESMSSADRYRRTGEAMSLLRVFWNDDHVSHHGKYWSYELSTEPTRTRQPPQMYFGGTSPEAREVAAQHADCYLMWIEPVAAIADLLEDIRGRAARHGRRLHFGIRTHVIVRETEDEARRAAAELVSALDPDIGRRSTTRQNASPNCSCRASTSASFRNAGAWSVVEADRELVP